MESEKQLTTEAIKMSQGFGTMTAEKSAELSAVSVSAAAKAEVEACYIMALKRPRNEEQARIKILQTCKNPHFAESAIYKKPVGGSTIQGPSIRFAEEALRAWGNVLSGQMVVHDDATKRVVRQTVRDLESNLSFTEDITIEKTVERQKADESRTILGQRKNSYGKVVYIVSATEDEVNIKKAAQTSKVIRNNGLRLIPQHIIDEAMALCQEAIRTKINKDPEAAKRQIFDAFAGLGIMPEELEKYLKHPLSQVTPAETEDLRLVFAALKEGSARWSDYVAVATPETAEKGAVSLKTNGKGSEQGGGGETVPQGSHAQASAFEKNMDKVKASLVKSVGEKKAKELIMNTLGSFGYESVDMIPNEKIRSEFLNALIGKYQELASKK